LRQKLNRDSLFAMASKRAARRAEVREGLLAAARARVAAGGFDAAAVADVARDAGVAAGTVYRHFDAKAELLAEVFTVAADSERELIGAIVSDRSEPPGRRLAHAVEAFARRALAAPVLAYALMAEPVDPAVEAARLASKRAYRDLFAGLLEEGAAAGDWPPLDAGIAAAALVGALQEALIGPLADDHVTAGREALIASLVGFALHAVNAKEPSRWQPSTAPVPRRRTPSPTRRPRSRT
jgi:AcrR family transcriptional regulator